MSTMSTARNGIFFSIQEIYKIVIIDMIHDTIMLLVNNL